ncbi:hypothetical protein FHT78_004888 [Rhizobium sp. BK196]|uniref:hypothetical protein n=1 Tax=Rhizobium sp. BK196 TaxID=2587073 RepID=UPI00161D905A|nr:hypothetical protein [Rhizobium sp. BK196]MBB3313100.1 hypothetical protein [Rhizobium sp. BK196]
MFYTHEHRATAVLTAPQKMTMRRFDEIRLLSKQVMRWRFLDRENRWEIAAFRVPSGNDLLRASSV